MDRRDVTNKYLNQSLLLLMGSIYRPLNTIGLPHYDQALLSSWTPQFVPSNMYYPPPAKIPPQVLNTMKTNDNVAYAALPRELKGRRNMLVSGRQNNNGRFRSGKRTQEVCALKLYPLLHNHSFLIERTRDSHV